MAGRDTENLGPEREALYEQYWRGYFIAELVDDHELMALYQERMKSLQEVAKFSREIRRRLHDSAQRSVKAIGDTYPELRKPLI